jgi:6-phosphofructokinase 2
MKPAATLTLNPAIDIHSTVDYVVSERKLRSQEVRYEPGGGGINVSRALRNIGGKSDVLYTSGGPTGKILEELLDQEDLHHLPMPIEEWTRQNYTALESSTGRQYRFGMPGPEIDGSECPKILAKIKSVMGKTELFVISGSLPPGLPRDFYGQVTKIGKGQGIRIILDTSGPPLKEALEAGVYLIKPNLRELADLTGRGLEEESQQEEAILDLTTSGKSQVVVLSLGAAGVLTAQGERIIRMRTPTVRIKSKVGAGDSTVAGILFGLMHEKPIEEAVAWGVAAGAAAVMTPGSQLCRGEDVRALFKQIMSGRDTPKGP